MSLPNNKWLLMLIGGLLAVFVLPRLLTLVHSKTATPSA